MFDVSFFELAVIGLIALLALGPERLPGAARTLGALLRRARASWFNLKSELERELDAEALRRPFGEAQREVEQPFDLLGRSLREVSQTLDPKRLTRKVGLLSDSPATDAAVAAMGAAARMESDAAALEATMVASDVHETATASALEPLDSSSDEAAPAAAGNDFHDQR
ncbi:MAG: Sec-independent protein translocase protein TatB [Lysobacterales bacterium]